MTKRIELNNYLIDCKGYSEEEANETTIDDISESELLECIEYNKGGKTKEKSIYDNIEEPKRKTVKEKQEILANIIIPELGEWVKKANEDGLRMGLTKEEVKEVLKLTFSILSRKPKN